ncbi:MAG: hypothetical protein KDK96_06670 [Chlamydiia bacterium]|nr:hypothetical protein [Chlamydiia bacterium]
MKKWILILLFLPCILLANTEFYIGEMKSQSPDEEEAEHYGFFFLKRTFLPDQNRFIDSCFLNAKDGEVLELKQISDLSGDLHEIVFKNPSGLITGTGELVGFPWEWTSLKERMVVHSESPIEIDVQNRLEGDSIISIASVYTIEEDGSKEFFGTFSARLFKIDRKVFEHFFSR